MLTMKTNRRKTKTQTKELELLLSNHLSEGKNINEFALLHNTQMGWAYLHARKLGWNSRFVTNEEAAHLILRRISRKIANEKNTVAPSQP